MVGVPGGVASTKCEIRGTNVKYVELRCHAATPLGWRLSDVATGQNRYEANALISRT